MNQDYDFCGHFGNKFNCYIFQCLVDYEGDSDEDEDDEEQESAHLSKKARIE